MATAGCASSQLTPVRDIAFAHPAASSRSRDYGETGSTDNLVFNILPAFQEETTEESEHNNASLDGHPAIHGPYSLLLVGDFIAPGKDKLDEAYGVDSRFLIRVVDDFYLGGTIGYARMKNDDTRGLIEGELHRYTAMAWAEYRLRFGKTTWSPSVDFGFGTGWFIADPVPLSERRKEIEALNRKLKVGVISAFALKGSVQLRLPVLRSTDMSISEGNADFIFGIATEYGEGIARYSVTDYAADIKTKSRGKVPIDAFHVFLGLSFRF
jgi:hypothetical protein